MYLLIMGLALFLGVHLLRELRLRENAIARLGDNTYKALFSLVALAGLALIVWGKSTSSFLMIYEPRYELRGFSHFAMLPASILLVAGNLPVSHLRHATRHPMLLGTAVWGAAHLWANGDLASLLLFGSFTCWALLKFVSLTISQPPSARQPSLWWDFLAVVVGFILYGLVTVFHGQLFGIGLTFE
ncbi:MAG: NnrU family protein [Gammaproteobacteria bacterium]